MMCYQYAFHGYHKCCAQSQNVITRLIHHIFAYVQSGHFDTMWCIPSQRYGEIVTTLVLQVLSPFLQLAGRTPTNWHIIDAFGRLASISKQNPIKINRERSSWSNTELFINNRQNTEYFHNSFIQLAEILSFQQFSLIFRHIIGLSTLMFRFWPCS